MAYSMSQHLVADRSDRAVYILTHLEWTKIIKEQRRVDEKGRVSDQCLTDSGVMLALDASKRTIITMYVATQPKVSAMYEGNTPSWVLKMIKKNKHHAEMQNKVRY